MVIDRCPFCLEDLASPRSFCPHCDEPLTPEAEQDLAPPEWVERARDLRSAKAKGNEALVAVLIGPFLCWLFIPPLGIARAFEARKLYRKHGESGPVTATIAIVIGVLELCTCGFLMFGNA